MHSRRITRLLNHLQARNSTLGVQRFQVCRMSTNAVVEDEVLFESPTKYLEVVTLNRKPKFNALNLNMVRMIKPKYDEWVARKGPVCVYMVGAGEKAFCAGGDVQRIRESTLAGGSDASEFFYEEYQLNHRIGTAFERNGLVQVAVWDGITMGGGVGLSVHGKIRVATEKTLFAMPESHLGLFPDVGGTFALSRIKSGMPVGLYMALTGCRIGPADCIFAGLATHYVPRDKLNDLREGLIKLDKDAGNYEKVCELLDQVRGDAQPPVDGRTGPILRPNLHGIETCFKFETLEEIMSALNKYIEDFKGDETKHKWAKDCLDTLLRASPTSLKVTIQAVHAHAAPTVTLGTALANEYRITQRMCKPDGDFFEGVRAILVDKDNAPKWSHPHIADVDQKFIDEHFAPLPQGHPKGELRVD